jgi:beta-phosphoglucomutase family hydrolase
MTATVAKSATSVTRLRLPAAIRACLFDLDGVLTDTASAHEEAWKQMFDAFLQARATREHEAFVPFTPQDYEKYVDGKQRFDGVRSFLRVRGIELPEGSHADRPELDTIGGLGNRKNELLLARIERHGVRSYPGSIAFVRAALDAGLRCAVVSASANCHEVLQAVGIADLFEARVDGIVAERDRLAGKPAPDTFLAAARVLQLAPSDAAVFEDALAGVSAARSGGFGYVVGVDRVGHPDDLRASGADIVVRDLSELMVTR